MAKSKFPHVLAAVETRAKRENAAQWEIGDALVLDIAPRKGGPTSRTSDLEPIHSEFAACSRELVEAGHEEYSASTLKQLRLTASHFPAKDRIRGISFGAHCSAVTPEALRAIVAGAPDGTAISVRYVRKIQMRQMEKANREHEKEMEQRRAKLVEARRESQAAQEATRKAKEKVLKAKDETERRAASQERLEAQEREKKARQKVDETWVPIKSPNYVPPVAEVPIFAMEGDFMHNAGESARLADRTRKDVMPHIELFKPTALAMMQEAALEAANKWRELAELVRKTKPNKPHGLYAVS